MSNLDSGQPEEELQSSATSPAPLAEHRARQSRISCSARSFEALVMGAAAIPILCFLVHETYELDVWWQVTTGRDILATGRLPHTDIYRQAALGQPYHNPHWLFQILLALAERPFGMAGVQLVTLAFWLPTLSLVYLACRRWLPATPAAVLLFLAALVSVERFLPRPEIATYLGVAALYYLLQERRYRTALQVLVLGAIEAVWLSSHGLFCIGPFLVGCYWLQAFARWWRGRESDLRPLSWALVTVLLATLLSPYGLGPWRNTFLMLSQTSGGWAPRLFEKLGELSPTFGEAFRSAPAFWAFLTLLCLTVVLAAAAVIRGQVSAARLLIGAGLLAAACSGRRNVVLFALVAAPLASECAALLLPAGAYQLHRMWAVLPAGLMLGVSWFPLSGAYYQYMELWTRAGWGVTASYFPHGLPAFLQRIEFRGAILNSPNLGGFYMYHGFPDRLPLIDGLWITIPPDRLERIVADLLNPLAWRSVADDYQARGVLLSHASAQAAALVPSLAQARDWVLVYYDAAASFWMKADDARRPPAIDPSDPQLLPPLRRVEDAVLVWMFLDRMQASPQVRLSVLERMVGFGYRKTRSLTRLGLLQLEVGRTREADQTFQTLLRLDGENLTALNQLAYLAHLRGEPELALRLLERALQIDPESASTRRNYDALRLR